RAGRRPARLRREARPRRPLPRGGVPRPAVALRGLRPAGAGGDGVRNAGRRDERSRSSRGRRRSGGVRRAGRARGRRSARARRTRDTRTRRTGACPPLLVGRDRAPRGRRIPRGARSVTRVAAVVVSHGHAQELRDALPALAPQVDELVLIENLPGSVDDVPERAIVLRNDRPLTFAANLNQGIAVSTAQYVLSVNPDAV